MVSRTNHSRPQRGLVGKVAIVTGAGSQGDDIGNGRAIAILLAEDGASVVCADIDLPSAQVTADMIKQGENGSAIAFAANVASEKDCAETVQLAIKHFGRLDILINNVGIFGAQGTALDADATQWARSWEVNVTSMVFMAKYAIPEMEKNVPVEGEGGIRGSIVNLGSITGLQGGWRTLFYPTSKGAIVNMTRVMASNHGKQGIRVNCLCPGLVYTPMVYGDGMSEKIRETRRQASLLENEGTAWDCAAAARFLAGNEARWITGTNLNVDAGASSTLRVSLDES